MSRGTSCFASDTNFITHTVFLWWQKKIFEKPYCALHACTYTLPARFLYTAQQLSSSCLRTFAQWQILIISFENYELCLPLKLVKSYGFQKIANKSLRIFFTPSLYCSVVELFLSLYICTMVDFAKVCPQIGLRGGIFGLLFLSLSFSHSQIR